MEIQNCFIPHCGEDWQRKDSVFQSSVQQKTSRMIDEDTFIDP